MIGWSRNRRAKGSPPARLPWPDCRALNACGPPLARPASKRKRWLLRPARSSDRAWPAIPGRNHSIDPPIRCNPDRNPITASKNCLTAVGCVEDRPNARQLPYPHSPTWLACLTRRTRHRNPVVIALRAGQDPAVLQEQVRFAGFLNRDHDRLRGALGLSRRSHCLPATAQGDDQQGQPGAVMIRPKHHRPVVDVSCPAGAGETTSVAQLAAGVRPRCATRHD